MLSFLMRRLLLSILSPFLICISAGAAIDTSGLIHYHLKTGLPTNNVYSGIIDRNGYCWFASDHGMIKYNGYTMQVFNAENGSLPSDDVFDMWEDSRGRIWLKSFSDKIGYIKNGKFREIHYPHGNRVLRIPNFAEHNGIVYFRDESNEGVNIVFATDDYLTTCFYSFAKHTPRSKQSNYYGNFLDNDIGFYLSTTDSFKFHIWTRDMDLLELDYINNRYITRGKYPKPFVIGFSYGLYSGPTGIVNKARADSGDVVFFNLNTLEFFTLDIKKHGADPSERVITNKAYYYPGNYYRNSVIVSNSHLYAFDSLNNFIKREKFSDILPTNKMVPYQIEDARGNMWYTTNGDGIWCKPFFYHFYEHRQKHPELLNGKFVGKLGKTSFWWMKGALSLCEVQNGKVTNTIPLPSIPDVKSVSGNDEILYISASETVYEYKRKAHRLTSIIDKYHQKLVRNYLNYNDNGVQYLLHSTRNSILIGNRLFLFIGNGCADVRFSTDTIYLDVLDNDRYNENLFDPVDSLMYSYSNNKIVKRNVKGGELEQLDINILRKGGINSIRQIAKDRFRNLFILDEKGLFLFDERTKEVRRINVKFSLAKASFQLLNDKIYIAGKFGFAVADIKGLFKVSDFRILPNIVDGGHASVDHFIVDENRTALIQTESEIYTFSLDSLEKYTTLLDGRTDLFSLVLLEPDEKKINANDTFSYQQSLNLLRLDVINTYGKGEVKYSYRIDGAEKWQESVSGEIFIATLKPGVYHKVECMVRDDVWRSNVHTFYIYRYPYWWQTQTWKTIFWIAGVLVLILLITITIFVTRYYSAKKDEKKRALTELELRAIHAQINPHFIFNTLGAALFFINKKRFDDAYTHVNKFSKLLRSYLKSSQNRFVILGEEIEMLRNYIELQQIRFEEKFTYAIEIDNKLPVNNIQIPSLLLQPLVENAINHGLFHSEVPGELLIRFMQGRDNTEMVCEIEDNGIGRQAAKKINDESSTKESYGTKLTNKLLDIFKQYEHMDISLSYTDKPYPNTGTIVRLIVKNLKYVT